MAGYTPLPYVRPAYQSRRADTIGQLLGLSGQRQAELELRRGDAAAQMWQNIGQTIAGTVQNYQQQKEREREQQEISAAREIQRRASEQQVAAGGLQLDEARREQGGRAFERSMVPLALRQDEDGAYSYDRDLLKTEFEKAGMADRLPDVFKGLDEADAATKTIRLAKQQAFAGLAFSALRSGATPQAVEEAFKYSDLNGLASREEIAQFKERLAQAGEQLPQALMSIAAQNPNFAKLMEPKAPVELNENTTLVDPDTGRVIASGPPKVRPPVNVTRGGKLIDPDTGAVIAEGAPIPPPQGPQDAKEWVIGPDGQQYHRVPQPGDQKLGSTTSGGGGGTPSMRAGIQRLESSLQQLEALDAALTQRRGIGGKVEGRAQQAYAAVTGENEDVTVYDAISASLLPALARSSGEVGNLAQQEQTRYAKLAPKVSDPKNIRDKKYAAIRALVAASNRGASVKEMAPLLDYDQFNTVTGRPQVTTTPPAPRMGEERIIEGKPARWDGRGWLEIRR